MVTTEEQFAEIGSLSGLLSAAIEDGEAAVLDGAYRFNHNEFHTFGGDEGSDLNVCEVCLAGRGDGDDAGCRVRRVLDAGRLRDRSGAPSAGHRQPPSAGTRGKRSGICTGAARGARIWATCGMGAI